MRVRSPRNGEMNWTEYHSTEAILAWLDSIQQEFPEWVEVTTIGTSFEGRPLRLLKLSKNSVITYLSLIIIFIDLYATSSREIGEFSLSRIFMQENGSLQPQPHSSLTNFWGRTIRKYKTWPITLIGTFWWLQTQMGSNTRERKIVTGEKLDLLNHCYAGYV